MPLMNPARPGALLSQAFPTSTSASGTSITAHTSVNTKGATPTQLISSTSADSYGIFVYYDGTAASNLASATLLDIMTGAGGSEVVLIPDLMVGWRLSQLAGAGLGFYYFPIFIPSGTRLSARSASGVSAKVTYVSLTLLQRPSQLGFVGTRVTAYGVDASNSRGTLTTSGNNAYGTPVSHSASTDNPVRYMQIGMDCGSRTTNTDQRVRAAIYTGSSVLVDDLQGNTDTGTENININEMNAALSLMQWNLPASIDLSVATMHNTTGASFSSVIYGVD